MIAATAATAGYALAGWRLAALAGGTFVWIAVMGQWKWAMEMLSVIVIAVPFSVAFGPVMGTLASRSRLAERILNPVLSIAQSLPHFAYMIPVVVFIGVGPKAGAIVTIIFSVPPMIRMTLLGLGGLSPGIIESGKMSGTTRLQLMTRVRLPAARTEILIGVYQVIMQILAMVVLASFIGMPGWWDRAMITAYTVFVSVTLAIVIGVPLGLIGAANETRARRFLLVRDTAQTFPSFIYLIPVIMLFGVIDVAVVAAVMVFATVPIIRYTIEGLRMIPPEIVESAQMSGASAGQLLSHVKLPLAVPTLVVGAHQSIMFALFRVIIAAFIGTQDLGQEMQRALSSNHVGKGLVLGFAVAFMGLMADHLLLKWAGNRKIFKRSA